MRLIAIVAMVGSVLLTGVVIYQSSQSRTWTLIGAALAATLPAATSVYAMGWTEGCFFFLLLVSALSLHRFAQAGSWPTFLGLTLTSALVLLIKFPGAAWLLAVSIVLLIRPTLSTPRRVLEAAVYLALAALPTLAWVIRNAYIAGDAWGRIPAIHPVSLVKLRQAFGTVLTWLIPEAWLRAAWVAVRDEPLLIAALMAACLIVVSTILIVLARSQFSATAVGRVAWRSWIPEVSPSGTALALFAALYVAMLVISMHTLDADTPMDSRKLLPILIPLIPAVTLTLQRAWQFRSPWAGAALALSVGLVLVSNTAQSVMWAHAAHTQGIGYNAIAWRDSGVVRRVSGLRAETKIYSNHPQAVYLNTGRSAALLPMTRNPTTLLLNTDYEDEVAQLKTNVVRGSAVVALFDLAPTADYLLSEDELRNLLPDSLERRETGGSVYSLE
jgi:hypothetical protein